MKYLLAIASFATVVACNNASQPAIKKTINPKWKGEWERTEWAANGGLSIDSISADSLYFNLTAMAGANGGELEGAASITDSVAIFHSFEGYDTCHIVFTLKGDSLIVVDQQRGSCFGGMGVEYSGKFYNEKYPYKPKKTWEGNNDSTDQTMSSLEVLNEAEDSALKALTKSEYSLFVNSTQLSNDDDDLDSLNAKVRSSGVQGLYTMQENIVMIDSSKNIWAAVIKEGKVLYYTNTPKFTNQLPKTIDNWRSRFADYPVVYKNKD